MTSYGKKKKDTYLQFLHFSPNNIPFPHTMHVCDIQYFVENLQMQDERLRSVHVKEAVTSLWLHTYGYGA